MLHDPVTRMIEIAEDDFGIQVGSGHKSASILLSSDGLIAFAFGENDLAKKLHSMAFQQAQTWPTENHAQALEELSELVVNILPPPSSENGYGN